LISDIEISFDSTSSKHLKQRKEISNICYGFSALLDQLELHGKASEYRAKAVNWKNIDAAPVQDTQTTTTRQVTITSTKEQIIDPIASLEISTNPITEVPQNSFTSIIRHNISESSQSIITSTEVTHHIYFTENSSFDVIEFELPKELSGITTTPQLVYCIGLMNGILNDNQFTGSQFQWLCSRNDEDLQQLNTVAVNIVIEFIRDELKNPDTITEVTSLAPILFKSSFKTLLDEFINKIHHSVLLKDDFLTGLSGLIRNAPLGYLDPNDLVQILDILYSRLIQTHQQSTDHTFKLILATSSILDSMVDCEVKGLKRVQLHEPLSKCLKDLKDHTDPSLVYQAAYAYQALQHIPDDDTPLRKALRRTGKVIQGVSGVLSAVKSMNIMALIDGLKDFHEGVTEIGSAAVTTLNGSMKLYNSGASLLDSLKECLNSNNKKKWYLALRGLDSLIQEGRFPEFEQLIRKVPCRNDPVFQCGVYLRLESIARNEELDFRTRKSAILYLRELYKDSTMSKYKNQTQQWVPRILQSLSDLPNTLITNYAKECLSELDIEITPTSQGYSLEYIGSYSSSFLPSKFPLLNRVQKRTLIEPKLLDIKRTSLQDRPDGVYIPPMGKTKMSSHESFDLKLKVNEFLQSDKKVLLILGSSGAGKSTFNRILEADLWSNYRSGDRIPLFIYLPLIDRPDDDLIAKHLRKFGITEDEILQLKMNREFILICDAYDETQLHSNIYRKNQLNMSGGWKAQMIISCRTKYNGKDYIDQFQPDSRNNAGVSKQFQECVISPFNKQQINEYIQQHISICKPSWGFEKYEQAFQQIPNLFDLVTNPFLLRLAVEILPE
jgi:hypothetical protein